MRVCIYVCACVRASGWRLHKWGLNLLSKDAVAARDMRNERASTENGLNLA